MGDFDKLLELLKEEEAQYFEYNSKGERTGGVIETGGWVETMMTGAKLVSLQALIKYMEKVVKERRASDGDTSKMSSDGEYG